MKRNEIECPHCKHIGRMPDILYGVAQPVYCGNCGKIIFSYEPTEIKPLKGWL